MTPQYTQRKRISGYRHPPNTRYCGRGTIYGNPFVIGEITRTEAVTLYAEKLDIIAANLGMTLVEFLSPLLAYSYLSCFCAPGDLCHVKDVLIPKLAALL